MGKETRGWGDPPWQIDFEPPIPRVPAKADFAVVGGGFTGLAAAAWLRRLAPDKEVVLLENGKLGGGASGRSGGIVLDETAAGKLPGLGNILVGFAHIIEQLRIACDLTLTGAWELGRKAISHNSPIQWQDSGSLGVVQEVPGGTLDPGKLVSGLARAAHAAGALLCEQTPVQDVEFTRPLSLRVPTGTIEAERVLFATNASTLELSGLGSRTQPRFTLAATTEPLSADELEQIGLGNRKAFYTVDLPYLWGRVMPDDSILFGSKRIAVGHWQALERIGIRAGESLELYSNLHRRVRELHPALRGIHFAQHWGGPELFTRDAKPIFSQHPRSPQALVLSGYSGHGIALSVYLGCWAAEVLVGQRELPNREAPRKVG